MNVLVVFTYGYSLETWKESGTILRELSIYKTLSENYDIKFTFLTFSENESELDYENYGINVIPIYKLIGQSKNKYVSYLKSFTIPFYIRNILKDIDIVKQNQLLGSWISIIIKIFFNKPLFIRTGYDMYKFSLEEKKSFFTKFMYKLLTSLSIFFSDVYSVSSIQDVEFLKQTFKNKKNITLRQNWVMESDYIPLEKRIKNKVLSVGRLENQKNFDGLIKNLKGSDFILDIVGNGSLRTKLEKQAEFYDVHVNFINSLENFDLLKLMENYKYYVSTSLYEGNPKTILEAMSKGCIVIASDIANHSEIIKDNYSGLIFDWENDNLAKILDELNHNSVKALDLSKNAHNYVQKNFSLEKISNDEFSDYLELLKDSK